MKITAKGITKETDVLVRWPELRQVPEFMLDFDPMPKEAHPKVLRYVLLTYMRDSDLAHITNIAERKAAALSIAGFEKAKKGQYADAVLKMVAGEVKGVAALINKVFRMTNDRKWAKYCSLLEDYYQKLAMMRQPTPDDDKAAATEEKKGKVRAQLKDYEADLDALEKELYRDDDELKGIVEDNGLDASDVKAGCVELFATGALFKDKK